MEKIKVLLADDSTDFMDVLREALEAEGGISVTSCVSDGRKPSAPSKMTSRILSCSTSS